MRRDSRPLACILVDIDFFKLFNDREGHQAGDECLRRVATALDGVVRRAGDFFARYGGEEFVALLPGTDAAGAEEVAGRMRDAVRALAIAHPASAEGRVTVSAGIAVVVPDSTRAAAQLVAAADEALYRAKANGRDRVEVAGVSAETSMGEAQHGGKGTSTTEPAREARRGPGLG
jgi:diguanylate cyclase (GGDEF)-like protein